MGKEHVSHTDIANWAIEKVNLPRETAKTYRDQANRLRDRLDSYLKESPDFSLKKMLLSGSLAKGTALKDLNDIDVACYISGDDAPEAIRDLLSYLAERLRNAFPNFSHDQVRVNTYSVTVSFRGTGLDVDVVPIIYYGDPDWHGKLVSQEDGSYLMTCIPRHLEFIRNRKSANQTHFAQVTRLAKYWVKNLKMQDSAFRFKSFMVELIMAKLADDGLDFSDYPEALQSFFTYIAKSDIREQIAFSDYYSQSDVKDFNTPVQIIDPVNSENNASRLYTENQADAIVNAALDAGDAIDAALRALTKQKTVYYWQKVFGQTFQI